jgi:hypothetical protein
MAIKVTLDGVGTGTNLLGVPDVTEREQIYQGALTLSGNYGGAASHGDTLSFANIFGLLSQRPPLKVEIYEQPAAGVAPSFYSAVFQLGTTIANGAVNFSLAGTEYTQGTAYAGAIATAVWKFRAWFPLGQ